jgi:membrane protein YqaA with SNARE-associated domain
MTLAQPSRWLRLATLTTVTSVLGGLFGYFIGQMAIDAVMPWLERVGYIGHFRTAERWFEEYGFWAIFAAGFTPIPYKVFTIAAGAASMGLLPVRSQDAAPAFIWLPRWCDSAALRSNTRSVATSMPSDGRRSRY